MENPQRIQAIRPEPTLAGNTLTWFNLFVLIVLAYTLFYKLRFHFFKHKLVGKSKGIIFSSLQLFVLATGVMFFWKGAYSMVDNCFYPDFPLISNLLAIVIGFILILFMGGKKSFEYYIA